MFNQENIIGKQSLEKHLVSKYEFKNISNLDMPEPDVENPDSENVAETTNSGVIKPQRPASAAPTQAPSANNSVAVEQIEHLEKAQSLEKELIERLLQKSDQLSDALAKLQLQFEKLQAQTQEQTELARENGFKDGYNQAKEEIKKEFGDEMDSHKQMLTNSIITLENAQKDAQTHLQNLEKELSAIAVDIAREVIVKEIEQSSQKVALALAKELLASIMDATDVTLKVNPSDYVYLKEKLESENLNKVHLESEQAVAPGGVVISGGGGNIDGNIMSRYKNLKQSILENIELENA